MKIMIMKLFVLALGSCLKPQDILHITSISYVFIAIKYSYRLHFMNAHLVITDSITTLLYVRVHMCSYNQNTYIELKVRVARPFSISYRCR